jgi:hypothetical protein
MTEVKINEYHKAASERKMRSVAYWIEHPKSLEECLAQFKRLRAQRLAKEYNSASSKNSQ